MTNERMNEIRGRRDARLAMLSKENTPCDVCENYDNSCRTPASCPNNNYRNFKWHGPRDEGKEVSQ